MKPIPSREGRVRRANFKLTSGDSLASTCNNGRYGTGKRGLIMMLILLGLSAAAFDSEHFAFGDNRGDSRKRSDL